jgi:hypothetical protein
MQEEEEPPEYLVVGLQILVERPERVQNPISKEI